MRSLMDEDDLSRPISAPRPVASGASTVNHNPLSVRVTDTSIGQFDPRTKPGIKVDDAYSVLNPDLPSRDALYIFVNFISYTRTPKQGSQGVRDEQLKHASRLLDYARDLSQRPRNRVSALHIKYRFPEEPGSKLLQGNPRPFPVMLDPVIKIDMKPTGTFEPAFAAAIFQHIAQNINPAPKNVVVAYVGAEVTGTHIRDLSVWCSNRVPAVTTFSVTECRIRDPRPLEEALGDALDISMYLNEGESPVYETYPGSGESLSAHRPFGHSTSGGSYLRAKEKALRQFGVITNSYSSGRGSWVSDIGVGSPNIRALRGHTLEAIIDSMGLGDGNEAAANRQERDLQLAEMVKPKDFAAKSSSSSAPKRSWRQNTGSEGTKAGGRTWRDLVVAQNDRFNPEYIDPDV